MTNNTQQIWTGTKGELWLNNADKILNIQSFSFKQSNKWEDVDDTDTFATKKRLVGVELTGELTKFKVDFAFNDILEEYKNMKQVDLTLTGCIKNPDTGEEKRISITGVTLNDMDIFSFEKGKVNQDVISFNATDYEYVK